MRFKTNITIFEKKLKGKCTPEMTTINFDSMILMFKVRQDAPYDAESLH